MKGTRINLLLVVKDINESVDFYENLLGFKKNVVLKNDDGSLRYVVRYVDFTVGTSILMLVPENSRKEKNINKENCVEFYIDIDEDIKVLFDNLKQKGLIFTKELYETPWETYQFHFKDPDGYVLIVSQVK